MHRGTPRLSVHSALSTLHDGPRATERPRFLNAFSPAPCDALAYVFLCIHARADLDIDSLLSH